MLRLITLPFCRVVMLAPWNEPPRRRFVAYRCRNAFRRLLGHAVIDEFATLSSPVLLGPAALAGKLYDAGLSLAHRRDPEMAVDLGWPPLVVGLDEPAPALPTRWQDLLLEALASPVLESELTAGGDRRERRTLGLNWLERVDVGDATLWITDVGLLPKQLGRLCEVSARPFSLAVTLSQPVARLPAGRSATFTVAGEERLQRLLAAAGEMGP